MVFTICFVHTSAGIRTRVRALATPGDNRYTTDVLWCPDPDSNRGQLPLQGSALPLSYLGRQIYFTTPNCSIKEAVFYFPKKSPRSFRMGPLRFELRTSAMSRRRHNRLDHEPMLLFPFFAPKCNSIVRIIIYISFGWSGLFLLE